jgi:ABC-type uncharacterized transport system auxiliary subunit
MKTTHRPNRYPSALASIAATALLALGLTGCGAEKPIKYYQLTHPATTTVGQSAAPLDVSLMVRLFQTSHLYREDRIVYGNDTQELGVYDTQRWSQAPAELLQDSLARGLRSSGRFNMVTTLRSDLNAEFLITGRLYEFREVSANGVQARLNFDVELRDVKLAKVIWRHTYNHDEPSAASTVPDLVAAMDKNVQRSVQEVQDGILQTLSTYSRK